MSLRENVFKRECLYERMSLWEKYLRARAMFQWEKYRCVRNMLIEDTDEIYRVKNELWNPISRNLS